MSSETISLKKVFEKIKRLERERDLYKSALEKVDKKCQTRFDASQLAREALAQGAKIAGGEWQDADLPDEEFERLLHSRGLEK